jgi:hypothetical protein
MTLESLRPVLTPCLELPPRTAIITRLCCWTLSLRPSLTGYETFSWLYSAVEQKSSLVDTSSEKASCPSVPGDKPFVSERRRSVDRDPRFPGTFPQFDAQFPVLINTPLLF